jgi:uncharacterized membrane protein YbaN (DUF454 family)
MPDPSSDDVTEDGPPAEARVPRTGWRDRVRSKPGLGHGYRLGVFVLGLLFIVLGVALAVLPGPLTIPPVLLGIWIWSTEFRFAERLLESFKRKANEAWEHAKAHRISSTLITTAGLAAAGAVVWAVSEYELVERGRSAIGL